MTRSAFAPTLRAGHRKTPTRPQNQTTQTAGRRQAVRTGIFLSLDVSLTHLLLDFCFRLSAAPRMPRPDGATPVHPDAPDLPSTRRRGKTAALSGMTLSSR